ncbi:MAG: cobalt-precorrin-5B (C(1))-methyltransferase [Planctomycetota bacterium]
MSPSPRDDRPLRTGFTTGACAAAAARAATLACVEGKPLTSVRTVLPNGDSHEFPLERCERDADGWLASIVKDAGDDPDCTDGAELVARVELTDRLGVSIRGGAGVATVTKEGLGLELGTLSITPIPRRNLIELVEDVLARSAGEPCGALVELSVPGGEEMAKETLNERLGLVGGISILGTSGIVRPYSTAAYRASVVNAIDLASAVGHRMVVLSTGGRTEAYGMRLLPHLAEDAFIQAGDFIGTAVQSCARVGVRGLVVAMIGKLSKMADGKKMTHAAGSQVNLDLLARLAAEAGAEKDLFDLVRSANTARQALELCVGAGLSSFGTIVCRESARHLGGFAVHAGRAAEIQTVLVGFEGAVLGSWPPGLARDMTQDLGETR